MKKIKFLIITICILKTANAQVKFENFVPVENLPAELLPKKTDEIGFLFSESEDSCVWGASYNNEYKILSPLGEEFDRFYGTDLTATYENGFIIFTSRYPWRASMSVFTYTWDGKTLTFVKDQYYDPSQEAIDSAEAAILRGDFWAASNFYMQVMYPSSYMNEFGVGIELLQAAHAWAMRDFHSKNYHLSVIRMQGAMNYFLNETLFRAENQDSYEYMLAGNYLTEHHDSLGLWWGDYGYFLLMADSLDKCIEINTQLNIIYPQLSGPYLQLGDAHYTLGHIKPARAAYEIYASLMKEKGKEKNIPARVLDRLK